MGSGTGSSRASRTILLLHRMLLLSDGCFKEFDESFANVSKAEVTEEFLDDAKRWARALDVPLWMKEESEEPQPIEV